MSQNVHQLQEVFMIFLYKIWVHKTLIRKKKGHHQPLFGNIDTHVHRSGRV